MGHTKEDYPVKRYPVVDFHTHVLPKMDDGSRSAEMSLEMLRRMKDSGTDIVVATSHYYGQKESLESFLHRRGASLSRLREELDDTYPVVIPGAEVAFHFGIEKQKDLDQACIEGTRTLLLEMPFAPWSDYELNAVASLCYDKKLTVVLAHYERFVGFQKGNDMLERILKLPVFVQINAESLLPFFGSKPWIRMFDEHRAHLLGSDSHNLTSRAPNLDKARAVLRKKLGDDALDRIDSCALKLIGAEVDA